MITFTQGNLLEARTEALVNTVNTVGVMGKGIALMFKERFKDNFHLYAAACKAGEIRTGKMFVTQTHELDGPHWIINFPTKQHWRGNSRMEWITEGLQDLRQFLVDHQIKSVAIPPLGAGNGKLEWSKVRAHIEAALGELDTEILVFEPTEKYQNTAKRSGVEKLTPARALIAELVRQYWILGMECSLLEIQKLAWFLERSVEQLGLPSLDLRFRAHKYGPYANRLHHLLDGLDGSYLHCDKRLADASPFDVIWFEDSRREYLQAYLNTEAKQYLPALEATTALIDGFESPFGMELLATVDWLVSEEGADLTISDIRRGLQHWRGQAAADRKNRLFTDKALGIALDRMSMSPLSEGKHAATPTH